jgi:MFS superfamily sulfate permease-like transporter
VLVILLFLTGPIAEPPKAVLGAAIVSAAIGIVDTSGWRSLAATDRVGLAIAAATVAGVVIAGVLETVAFAVALTIVDAVRRSAKPGDAVLGWDEQLGRWADVEENPGAHVVPGVVVYRLDDRFFFANARYVKRRMRDAVRGAPTQPRWLVLDAEAATHVDTTDVDAIDELAGTLRDDGITLVVARMRARTKRRLGDAGLVDRIGPQRFHPTVRAAVAACVAAGAGSTGVD